MSAEAQSSSAHNQYNTARTMGRSYDDLGGDTFGWAQLEAQSSEEQAQIINELQANDMAVPRDLWERFNSTVMEEAMHQLNAVQDLESRGLTVDVDISHTHYTWPIMGEMSGAERSMDPRARSELGDLDFGEASVPIPVTRKDYDIPIRKLQQLERGGPGVSTAHARMAARVVSKSLEDLVFNGWGGQGAEHQRHNQVNELYGYRTHPDRHQFSHAGSGWDDDVSQVPEDLNQMVGDMEDDHFDGSNKILYLANDVWKVLRQDYAYPDDAGDKVVRDRVMEIPEIGTVQRSYHLPSGEAVMVEPVPEVVELVRDPQQIQNLQWETHGGMNNKYAVMAIYAPAVKSTYEGHSGVVHASDLLA